MVKIRAVLLGNKVSSNSDGAVKYFEKSRLGEMDSDKIVYMLEEAFFLVETGKMEVLSSSYKILKRDEVLKKLARADKKFLVRYAVFRDLRKKGYVVKSGLKFGADFRVYEKGKKIGGGHSKWICFASDESNNMRWQEFSSMNRVAHSTKKNLLIGIVDQENDVSYYEVSWKKIV
jgi:tRNA-intron endonuclease, archaea type